MSRCFPYPPPGYSSSNVALIESIKLRKERQLAKEQRKKDKRREKKEKKEKRNNKKEITYQHMEKSEKYLKCHGKANTDQLEKSSLTEEHELPICLHIPSSSAESTENNNKRKRQSPIDGNIIKLRLPSEKQKDSDALAIENPCSAIRSAIFPAQNKDETYRIVAQETKGKIDHGFCRNTDEELICSISGQNDSFTQVTSVKKGNLSCSNLDGSQYSQIIENWVPPQIQDTLHDGLYDLDWLYKGKNQVGKKLKSVDDSISCFGSSLALWPHHAQYLHEADVYALPFAVPF